MAKVGIFTDKEVVIEMEFDTVIDFTRSPWAWDYGTITAPQPFKLKDGVKDFLLQLIPDATVEESQTNLLFWPDVIGEYKGQNVFTFYPRINEFNAEHQRYSVLHEVAHQRQVGTGQLSPEVMRSLGDTHGEPFWVEVAKLVEEFRVPWRVIYRMEPDYPKWFKLRRTRIERLANEEART